MSIDISSIIGKHLSTSATPAEEPTAVEENAAPAVEEVTAVEESAAPVEDVAPETAVEEEETAAGLKVDFTSVVENKTPVEEPQAEEIVEDHEFFMSEDERAAVQGAIQSSIIVNAVSL